MTGVTWSAWTRQRKIGRQSPIIVGTRSKLDFGHCCIRRHTHNQSTHHLLKILNTRWWYAFINRRSIMCAANLREGFFQCTIGETIPIPGKRTQAVRRTPEPSDWRSTLSRVNVDHPHCQNTVLRSVIVEPSLT